ncbi:MAG: hypothetical protein ABH828_04915 [archaeon]
MGLGNYIIYLIGLVCLIWVIYDVVAVNKKLSVGMKVLWIILAILFSIITAIVYYFVYKK